MSTYTSVAELMIRDTISSVINFNSNRTRMSNDDETIMIEGCEIKLGDKIEYRTFDIWKLGHLKECVRNQAVIVIEDDLNKNRVRIPFNTQCLAQYGTNMQLIDGDVQIKGKYPNNDDELILHGDLIIVPTVMDIDFVNNVSQVRIASVKGITKSNTVHIEYIQSIGNVPHYRYGFPADQIRRRFTHTEEVKGIPGLDKWLTRNDTKIGEINKIRLDRAGHLIVNIKSESFNYDFTQEESLRIIEDENAIADITRRAGFGGFRVNQKIEYKLNNIWKVGVIHEIGHVSHQHGIRDDITNCMVYVEEIDLDTRMAELGTHMITDGYIIIKNVYSDKDEKITHGDYIIIPSIMSQALSPPRIAIVKGITKLNKVHVQYVTVDGTGRQPHQYEYDISYHNIKRLFTPQEREKGIPCIGRWVNYNSHYVNVTPYPKGLITKLDINLNGIGSRGDLLIWIEEKNDNGVYIGKCYNFTTDTGLRVCNTGYNNVYGTNLDPNNPSNRGLARLFLESEFKEGIHVEFENQVGPWILAQIKYVDDQKGDIVVGFGRELVAIPKNYRKIKIIRNPNLAFSARAATDQFQPQIDDEVEFKRGNFSVYEKGRIIAIPDHALHRINYRLQSEIGANVLNVAFHNMRRFIKSPLRRTIERSADTTTTVTTNNNNNQNRPDDFPDSVEIMPEIIDSEDENYQGINTRNSNANSNNNNNNNNNNIILCDNEMDITNEFREPSIPAVPLSLYSASEKSTDKIKHPYIGIVNIFTNFVTEEKTPQLTDIKNIYEQLILQQKNGDRANFYHAKFTHSEYVKLFGDPQLNKNDTNFNVDFIPNENKDGSTNVADEYTCGICLSIVPLDAGLTVYHGQGDELIKTDKSNMACERCFCKKCIYTTCYVFVDDGPNPNPYLTKCNHECPRCRGNIANIDKDGRVIHLTRDKAKLPNITKKSLETLKNIDGICNLCEKPFKYGDYMKHRIEKQCPIICPYEKCKMKIKSDQLDEKKKHFELECKGLWSHCIHGMSKLKKKYKRCDYEGTIFQVVQHLNTCPYQIYFVGQKLLDERNRVFFEQCKEITKTKLGIKSVLDELSPYRHKLKMKDDYVLTDDLSDPEYIPQIKTKKQKLKENEEEKALNIFKEDVEKYAKDIEKMIEE